MTERHAQGRGVQRPPASRFVILDRGFRLFFLAAASWAALLMVLFIFMVSGTPVAAPALNVVDWHAHELLFGYTGAVIAGFLLTAIPNWTKRYPIDGWKLAMLFVLWIAGRVAMILSYPLGPWAASLIELAYPVGLTAVVAREIIAGRNYRNLRVLALLVLFTVADGLFLYEAFTWGTADLAKRGGVAVIIMLIMLIGGRIVPSFTRNWLVRRTSDKLPISFNWFDATSMALSAVALASWVALPFESITAALLIVAGSANVVRLIRWKGWQTVAEQLVLVLHVAFAFVPVGLLALGVSILSPDSVPPTGALHLLTAGAIGLMTLAMMTRVSLGHTSSALRADLWIRAIYWSLIGAVALRFAYGYSYATWLLHWSAMLWILAFVVFLVRYSFMATRLNDPAFPIQ